MAHKPPADRGPRKAQAKKDLKKATGRRKQPSPEMKFLKALVPALRKPEARKPKMAPAPIPKLKGF